MISEVIFRKWMLNQKIYLEPNVRLPAPIWPAIENIFLGFV